MTETGENEDVQVEVKSVLKMFDANTPLHLLETATPVEEIHTIDGEVVTHIVNEEVVYDKDAGIGKKPDFAPSKDEHGTD